MKAAAPEAAVHGVVSQEAAAAASAHQRRGVPRGMKQHPPEKPTNRQGLTALVELGSRRRVSPFEVHINRGGKCHPEIFLDEIGSP